MIEEIAAGIRAAARPIAVLAGSGVSQSAGVPTGQDLLRGLARRRGEDAGPDPVTWYLGALETFPDYFGMVGDGTDALPDPIFDRPSTTPAHRAIGRMAAAGFVGPILTTNLDRLLERALREAGVPFDIAYDLDALARIGLDGVVLLKLHGDYRDIGIRHTARAAHSYHGVIDDLLDRVFAGFDLLVCGWSASWDVPLRRALRRAERERIWWLQCGPPSEAAQRIFAVRRPTVAAVEGSDEGLTELSALLLGTDRDARCGPPPGRAPDCGSVGHG
ncbi:SIR2 family protein [Microtetraspora sp. AC03309]|uniref:SIR2 family protein n=1 Tax=Microtetraspora sp. AC03309 TaxID=2779376 RepID=UPI001E5F83A5|nr:SIR2 family protein [Microtetraspora sp. AC03309]MCC5580329.1 SIR2 family protein [Microtetraspora sp. AC03309]